MMRHERLRRLSERLPESSLTAFLFAVLLVAIATATRLPFTWIGASLPFATYFPAILIVALLAGTRAGAFAAVLSLVAVWWAFMEPAFTFQNPSVPQLVDAGLFLVTAAFVVWVASLYRAANVQLSNNERSLTRLVREKEAILESALDCFVTIDEGGRVVEFNPAAERTFGIRRSDAIGKLLADLIIPPEFRDRHSAGMARYLATGNARVLGKRLEMEAIRLDGSRIPVEVSITASRSDGLLRFVGHIRDISEQKRASREIAELNAALEKRVADRTHELSVANEKLRAEFLVRQSTEEQVRQLQKIEAVGQLTGGIAHDFNNMLSIIMGSLRLLETRLNRGETNVQKYLESAMAGASRAGDLTKRLLAFSRQQALAPQPIEVNKIIAGMSDLLRRTIPENIAIETVLAGGLWRSHADPQELESALINIAVNARDAMPVSGRLTIETSNSALDDDYARSHPGVSAGQYVMLAVTDTGGGMPPDVIARAFDPFFTTKQVDKGTGLGLSQVYGFIKQSGGHVKIYSEVGHGTTIKIYLPRYSGEAVTAAPLSTGMLASPAANEKILVVEDEDSVRSLTVEMLQELGYRVIDASDAKSALILLGQNEDVNLLFTDVVMPGINGRQLADEAIRRVPTLKVLFATGYTRNAVVHNGVLGAGVEMMMKPYTAEALATKVAKVLRGG